MGKENDDLNKFFLSNLEELPHDVRGIVYLLEKGMGSILIARLIGRGNSFVWRKISWIRNYFVFIYLRHQYEDQIGKILNDFGHFKLKPHSLKKEAQIFKCMWYEPYLKRGEIALRFNIRPYYVTVVKNKYIRILLKKVTDKNMHMLIVYFNRCVFLSKGKDLLARKDFIPKKNPR